MSLLSICIPTYNRANFLQWTLERTLKDFPDAKVIVSDDCSSDGTGTLRFPGRFIRQGRNIGAFPNHRAVLLAASTQYCVYLGDDDYLLPDEVAKGVDFLEQHPEVSAYYAPCQLYDEVNQQANWDAFYVAEDETFTDSVKLWNFVMHKHVWPEHAIYRRAGLEDILQPRTAAYWCFVDLPNALKKGGVHFAKAPYYRNITQHPVGGRAKLGDQQCLTDFGNYQAGLEIMAFDLFNGRLTKELKQMVSSNIRQFIWSRFEVANRILLAQNRLPEAALIQKRMAMTGY